MREHIELGTTPIMEECVQVSDRFDYLKPMHREARMFKKQLEEQFKDSIPDGACFIIKKFPHDFGSYYDVCVSFDEDNEIATEFAYNLEGCEPEYWNVGHCCPVNLNEFANEELGEVFMKKFGTTDEVVYLVRIYTKDVHVDAFVRTSLYGMYPSELVDTLKVDDFITWLNENDIGVHYIKRDMHWEEPKSLLTKRNIEYYRKAMQTLAESVADMDEEDVADVIGSVEEQVKKDIESYPEEEDIRICWKCGLPLKYNSQAYEEGFHFDTCY
jgi:hypothetical protein